MGSVSCPAASRYCFLPLEDLTVFKDFETLFKGLGIGLKMDCAVYLRCGVYLVNLISYILEIG